MSTPTINVNLKPCTCGYHVGHGDHCRGAPVLIPLSLEPFRSVTFTVRLGECDAWECEHARCPARHISVTCSISGKMWKDSFVSDVEMYRDQNPGHIVFPYDMQHKVLPICRERWALVKALVLGHTDLSSLLTGPKAVELLTQRDAVFSALAKARWNEDGLNDATNEAVMAIGGGPLPAFGRRPSEELLARYVEHLVEQIGVMP